MPECRGASASLPRAAEESSTAIVRPDAAEPLETGLTFAKAKPCDLPECRLLATQRFTVSEGGCAGEILGLLRRKALSSPKWASGEETNSTP
jgi:hypothetical protein